MPTASTIKRAASTYLVHFFGGGLEDKGRYLVEIFETTASGEIRPLRLDREDGGGCTPRTTLSRRAVRRR